MTTREEMLDHEQARVLAAEAIDEELLPEEAAWLESHLAGCPECRAVADEYAAIHSELSGLDVPPPPRDLWVRTQAAFDEIDASRAHRGGRAPKTSRRPLIGSSIAVAAVVLLAGASLLAQTPVVHPAPAKSPGGFIAVASTAPNATDHGDQAPLAVVNGTSYWISSANGVYQITGGTTPCAASDNSCTVQGGHGQTLGTIASDSSVSAVIDPNANTAAVWTSDKVVILPLTDSANPVSLDLLTPQPTIIRATPTATPVATVAPTPAPTVPPTPAPTETPAATPTIAASPEPTSSQSAGSSPTPIRTASQSPAPTPTVAPTEAPTVAPTQTPTEAPTPTPAPATPAPKPTLAPSSGPLAILSGFEIIGRDPQFSPDGSVVAFSARPSDHSTGPDVFVWEVGDEQAHAVTTSHSAFFSGWFGGRVLISDIAAAPAESGGFTTTSYVFDPASERSMRIDRSMFMPVVDPVGRYVVYWSGSVTFDPATGLWQPGSGDLYFERWPNLSLIDDDAPTPTPTPQPASPTPLVTDEPVLSPLPSPTAPASTAEATATAQLEASAGSTPASGDVTPAPTNPAATPSAPDASSSASTPTPRPSTSATAAPTPTAAPTQPVLPQVLPVAQSGGAVRTWQVKWDAIGRHVAIWVANQGSSKVGRLTLFAISPDEGRIDVDNGQLLAADRVMANISFDSSHLIYTSAVDGKTYMQNIPVWRPSVQPTDNGGQEPSSTDRAGS